MRYFLLIILALASCNHEECKTDTDNDGIPNCQDDDDDNDNLTDVEEKEYNTNPLLQDTDDDGFTDYEEVMNQKCYLKGFHNYPLAHIGGTDPLTPTVLVEIDYMYEFHPDYETLRLATIAFADAGIEILFRVDVPEQVLRYYRVTIVSIKEQLLKNSNSDCYGTKDPSIHVIFAQYGKGDEQSTIHYSNQEDPAYAGIFIFKQTIQEYWEDNWLVFHSNGLNISLQDLVARRLVHELGHALGATDEGPNNGFNFSNVMMEKLGNPYVNFTQWQEATVLGYPTFSKQSIFQFTLKNKVSVETAKSTSEGKEKP